MKSALWCAVALCWLLPAVMAQQASTSLVHEDPAKIKTATTCRRCHVNTFNTWENTGHATGFKTLHRNDAALAIAKKMGFDLIKRESLCLNCHYTATLDKGKLKAESGVSCESCHGAAADWIDLHNNYGGGGATYATESPEHREQRIAQTRNLGMRRPSDLYAVAARCFQCHTVPNEQLVNQGGHGTGSAGFEFVGWSQGKLRHNFLDSFRSGDGSQNATRSDAQKRRMYVLGRMLDLEYSLRGVAVAKDQQRYFKAMARRVRSALGELRALNRAAPLPQLIEAMTRVGKAKILPNREKELLALADEIGKLARAFLTAYDGKSLAAIDPLVRGESQPEQEPSEVETPASTSESPVVAGSPASPASPTVGNNGIRTTGQALSQPTFASVAPFKVEGEKKSRLRPAATHPVVGPGDCSSCHRHEPQSRWWFEDAHYRSADPFLSGNARVLEISKNYGIAANQLTRGSLCMDCHGTLISGRESREVNDGVGCEACHGAAGDYLKVHQEGDAALGHKRPGYKTALSKGLAAMDDAGVRARICADCHYLTDTRLLSAGHKSGANFDIVAATAKIKHWPKANLEAAALKSAYDAEVQRRGPVPNVRRPPPTSATQPQVAVSQESKTPQVEVNPGKPEPRPQLPPNRPVNPDAPVDPQTSLPIQLEPQPSRQEEQTLEETLLAIKQRLEQLQKQVKRGGQGG